MSRIQIASLWEKACNTALWVSNQFSSNPEDRETWISGQIVQTIWTGEDQGFLAWMDSVPCEHWPSHSSGCPQAPKYSSPPVYSSEQNLALTGGFCCLDAYRRILETISLCVLSSACVCGGQIASSSSAFLNHPVLSFETRSLAEPRAHQLAKLVGLELQGSAWFTPPPLPLGSLTYLTISSTLCRCQRSKLRSLCLHNPHFISWVIFPAQKHLYTLVHRAKTKLYQ